MPNPQFQIKVANTQLTPHQFQKPNLITSLQHSALALGPSALKLFDIIYRKVASSSTPRLVASLG